jgi:hypothetical protein
VKDPRYSSQEETLTEANYILSGGSNASKTVRMLPFNCGVFLFEVMKSLSPHKEARLTTMEAYQKESFRAAPPAALALLIEHECGRVVAEKTVRTLSKDGHFRPSLSYSSTYRDCLAPEVEVTP